MRSIGDKVWVVVETDWGYQVQHLPITGDRVNSRGEVWLYFVNDSFGYETDRVYDRQEEAIAEIIEKELSHIREG
jgi:hypothetical protein